MANKTGYPSIDRPWEEFYKYGIPNKPNDMPWNKYLVDETAIGSQPPQGLTMYQLIYDVNKDYPDQIALNYFDKKTTFGELFPRIDECARALTAAGVKQNDCVMVSLVDMPEVVYSFYGADKIGASINLIDPRSDVETLKHYINQVNPKVFITLDLNYPLVKKAVVGTSVEKVVIVRIDDSMPAAISLGYKLKSRGQHPKIKYGKSVLTYKDFIASGKDAPDVEADFEKDACRIIIHTGGTTGLPKSVMLSDQICNNVAWSYGYIGFPIKRQNVWYNELPPFIIYSMMISVHLPLFYGVTVVLNPEFSVEKFAKNFTKYKPNYAGGVTEHWRQLIRSPLMKDFDMSFLIAAVIGGDACPREDEIEINEFFKAHGCKYPVIKGYGMSETSATVATETCTANRYKTVGIPLPVHDIKIVDPDDITKELKYDQIGELLVGGPNVMLGYLGDQEATDEMIFTDEKGERWLRTSDLAKISEDGFLTHKGRLRRIYITDNGGDAAKIFPSVPEKEILRHEDVDAVCCAGRLKKDSTFYEIVAFVVKKNDRPDAELAEELKKLCEEKVPGYMQPVSFEFIESLPLTEANGKVDFLQLEERARELQLAGI
ncbi:MAG: acyl--CoA ligase [Clostridia bacterium]|nr:acyl--CoA ligase [Clostridia bacterium]